jgi:hypothetical protein
LAVDAEMVLAIAALFFGRHHCHDGAPAGGMVATMRLPRNRRRCGCAVMTGLVRRPSRWMPGLWRLDRPCAFHGAHS